MLEASTLLWYNESNSIKIYFLGTFGANVFFD